MAWRVLVSSFSAILVVAVIAPAGTSATPARTPSRARGAGLAGATSFAGKTATATAIPDNCANLAAYPAFGQVCVKGSDWAPASLVAADTALHLNVKSNGPTTDVVDGSNTYGLKWQCTEFAVRWAAIAWGTGGNSAWVGAGWQSGAAQDMWQAAAGLHLQAVPNGSTQAPAPGDLLIFHENAGYAGPGHVAVVLKVDRATGYLTFIGENQWRAPAIVKVPISASNHVWTTGFASSLHVTYWLHNPAWSWPVSTTLSPKGYVHPSDPVCTTYGIAQGATRLTVAGAFYTPGDVLSVHTATVFLGRVTVSANGTWSLKFPVPQRPDGRYPVAVNDPHGRLATLSFVSSPYTCWRWQGTTWTWDAVGWDAYSPMTFYIDGTQTDYWSASADGAMPARTFDYSCVPGTHSWQVSGMRDGIPPGGLGSAGGSFSC